MKIRRIKPGTYAVTIGDPSAQRFSVRRDAYKGGWFIWTDLTIGPKWSEERFATKRDAIEYLLHQNP